eukprot:3910639-Heterocapsa_arctica.AAC.1
MGVENVHPKESRKLPIIWTNNGYVITLRSDPDGYASYGRVHWYGIEGMIANPLPVMTPVVPRNIIAMTLIIL